MTAVHNTRHVSLTEVVQFYLWACAFSWTTWLAARALPAAGTVLLPVGTFGPLIAALITTRSSPVRENPEQPRLKPRWYLVLVGPPAVMLAGIGLAAIGGHAIEGWQDPGRWYLVLPIVGYVALFGGPLGEEPGWRGFALDRLQSALRPVSASIVLGLAWAAWHWPLFLVEGSVQQTIPVVAFAWQIVVTSVFYTWMWNRTHSLTLAIAFHTVFNATVGLLPIIPEAAGTSLPLWISLLLATALATALVAATRGQLGREPRTPS